METKIISPENEIYNGRADIVVVPGEEGDFGAMIEHAPLITYLRPGKLEVIENDKSKKVFFVDGGFAKVSDNRCIIMVDYIKNIDDIDKKANNQRISILKGKITESINDIDKRTILEQIRVLETENDLA